MEAKKSPRFDLARIYALNVKELYELLSTDARCVAARIERGAEVSRETLAKSSMIRTLASRINLYSGKYDNVRCVERGDFCELADFVIEEAQEIIEWKLRESATK